MPKLLAPLEKEFTLIVESKNSERRVKKSDPIVVKFKQATESTNIRRQDLLSKPIRRWWDRTEENVTDQYREEYKLSSFGQRMAVDAYLSMTFCNITGEDDELLFVPKPKTFDAFLDKWGQLYPEWALVIYEQACLKVNPLWGGDVADENDDDQALTPGEELAAEAALQPA